MNNELLFGWPRHVTTTEDDMPLSPREQRILAAIEDELRDKDPALVATFDRARPPSTLLQGFPLPVRHVCPAGPRAHRADSPALARPRAEPGRIAILTVGLIAPWMVIAARAVQRRPASAAGGL